MAQYTIGKTDGSSTSASQRSHRYKNVTHTVAGVSATQKIISLSLYAKSAGGAAGNIRVALYNSVTGAMICQGSAEISVNSTDAQLWTHTSFVDKDGSAITPTVPNNTTVVLAYTMDSTDVTWYYGGATSGDCNSVTNDYTADFPDDIATWGAGTDRAVQIRMQCIHEDVAGGLSIPVAVNGAWKSAIPKVLVNGAWKSVAAAKILVNGAWKAHP